MTYDLGLVERIRDALARAGERGVREKNVFGGRGFLIGTKAFAIAWDEGLIVKMAPDEYNGALRIPDVVPFAPMGERPMGTWIVAGDEATADDLELLEWVRRGLRGVRIVTKPAVRRVSVRPRKPAAERPSRASKKSVRKRKAPPTKKAVAKQKRRRK